MLIPAKDIEKYKNRNKSIILPFDGEFGGYCSYFIKEVDLLQTKYDKIVCCKKGEECLFPSAKGFFYDWNVSTKDSEKHRFVTNQLKDEDVEKIKQNAIEKYSNKYTDDMQFFLSRCSRRKQNEKILKHFFKIGQTNCETPDIDICIAARKRDKTSFRDYPYWQEIINFFRKKFKIAILGLKETTQELQNIQCYSYNYGTTDACVELLRKSHLFISTETGLSHLNLFMETSMVVLNVPNWAGERKHILLNPRTHIYFTDDKCWKQPNEFIKFIEKIIKDENIIQKIQERNREKLEKEKNIRNENAINRIHPSLCVSLKKIPIL